ncbi:hypothetical protein [Erythrobacter sp.]|uniref:hypothetical protein n=1 Tax=Erythrobacter sp. TaxID=1042 RepID=UPI001425D87C|nr:hypothetical protein [Erythrobacter sp.]QIQ87365.1 MAG: hypothetical protein G9473_12210 [Erythrobacter sp.]
MSAAAARDPRSGFLGRGPYFWVGLFVASSLALGLLTWTGAVEGLETVLVLALVPLALLAAVLRAAQLSARAKAEAGSRGLAQARYVKRTALFTSLYLVAVASLSFFDKGAFFGEDAGPLALRVLLAVLPGLAIIGVFWAIGRLMIEEEDEFLRMLTVRQSLVATAVALSAASVWGFLESADLVVHLDSYWVAVAWFVGLFVGAAVNRVQHGTWGSV